MLLWFALCLTPLGMGTQDRLVKGRAVFHTLAWLRPVCASQGAGMDKEGFELVHLCSTFASDPFVMAFAKLIESGARLPASSLND